MSQITLVNATIKLINDTYSNSSYFGYSEIIKYCTNIKKVLFANLLFLCGHSIWFFYYLNFHIKKTDLETLFTINKSGIITGQLFNENSPNNIFNKNEKKYNDDIYIKNKQEYCKKYISGFATIEQIQIIKTNLESHYNDILLYIGSFSNCRNSKLQDPKTDLNKMNLELPKLDKSVTFQNGQLIPMQYENILCMDYDMNITLSLKDIKKYYLEPAFNEFQDNVKNEITTNYQYFILVDRNINTTINIIHELYVLANI
jgi:hypothetical protein